ncbi:hypothetical protein SAMN05661096_01384 [Marivirga sericea]|uniref:Glycosyl hydrolases family 32 N-terminal domain-containing protein n=1 Tax=Marivirga sericea TaxID=1028 RepID=A0A1X7J7C1_9BACT|nr:hypothetical protein SAMN05661096_01384 [Marivirga sericea]
MLSCKNELEDIRLKTEEQAPIDFRVLNKTNAPLISASNPWENGLIGYCMVLKSDENFWQMWYESFAPTANDDYKSYLCYATSKNGINWEKPKLGLVNFEGSSENNIILSGQETNGIHGPFIYKENGIYHLIVNQIIVDNDSPKYSIAVAYSENGVNWSKFSKIYDGYSDTQNVLLNFNDQKKLFVRKWIGEISTGERAVGISRINRFSSLFFEQAELAYRNNFEEDVYTNGAIKYDNLILCLTSIFNKSKGDIYLGLAYSRNGNTFYKYNNKIDWKQSQNSWDNKAIYASPSLVKSDNDSTYFLYYSGTEKNHDSPITNNNDYVTGIGRYEIVITNNEK